MSKNSTSYEVPSVNLMSNSQKKAALDELRINQVNMIVDYKDFAKERVHYRDLGKSKSAQSLKECNDAYTLSMWMGCLAPMREGFDFSSLAATWFSFKAMDALNPSFKEDSARMMANLRQSMSPQLAAFGDKHKSWKKFMNTIDNELAVNAAAGMNNEIVKALDNNSLDNMIMTPRQIASLKMNFSEQYYDDIRGVRKHGGSTADMQKCKDDYEKAMQHLEIIADNGGFDMAVVASEERYLVGLKIAEQPEYANVYNITSDIYGAKPEIDMSNGAASWSGDFYTGDGHKFTTGGYRYGAFEPRDIIALDGKAEQEFKDSIKRKGEQLASMAYYVESKECTLDAKSKKYVKEQIGQMKSEYKASLTHMLQDDGESGAKIKTLVGGFDKAYKSTYEGCKDGSEEYKALVDEMNHIVDKHCVQSIGVPYIDDNDNRGNYTDKRCTEMFTNIANAAGNPKDKSGRNRNGYDIMCDMREDYISQMSAQDMFDLLKHAGTNIEQGVVQQNKVANPVVEKQSQAASPTHNSDLDKPHMTSSRSGIDIDTPPLADENEGMEV